MHEDTIGTQPFGRQLQGDHSYLEAVVLPWGHMAM
jgi:hypothetical protein